MGYPKELGGVLEAATPAKPWESGTMTPMLHPDMPLALADFPFPNISFTIASQGARNMDRQESVAEESQETVKTDSQERSDEKSQGFTKTVVDPSRFGEPKKFFFPGPTASSSKASSGRTELLDQ